MLVHDGIEMKIDYIEMNDPDTFDVLPDETTMASWVSESQGRGRPAILSGAMYVGQGEKRTRLIDNIVLGDAKRLGVLED